MTMTDSPASSVSLNLPGTNSNTTFLLTSQIILSSNSELKMAPRDASHAGSWYSDNVRTLTRQLDQWLAQVPDEIDGIGQLPVPGARIIIAP